MFAKTHLIVLAFALSGSALAAHPVAPKNLEFCNKLNGEWTKANNNDGGGETFYPEIRLTATDGCEVVTYSHFETALGRVTTFHFINGVEKTDSHYGPNGLFDGETSIAKVVANESKVVSTGVHRQMTPQGLLEGPFTLNVVYSKADDTVNFVLTVQLPQGPVSMSATYKRSAE